MTSFDCVACGGCCAYSASWPQFIGDGDGADIPEDLVDCANGRMRSYGNRCAALEGEIGRRVSCSVYAERPLVCREFQPGSEDCVMVRQLFGLDAALASA